LIHFKRDQFGSILSKASRNNLSRQDHTLCVKIKSPGCLRRMCPFILSPSVVVFFLISAHHTNTVPWCRWDWKVPIPPVRENNPPLSILWKLWKCPKYPGRNFWGLLWVELGPQNKIRWSPKMWPYLGIRSLSI
jgi:hypothetical protein